MHKFIVVNADVLAYSLEQVFFHFHYLSRFLIASGMCNLCMPISYPLMNICPLSQVESAIVLHLEN